MWSEEFPNVVLRDMYVVVHDHAVQPFSDAMKKHFTVFSQDLALSNVKKKNKFKGQSSQVEIKVFAKDEKAVREAEDQLLDIIGYYKAPPVDDPRIVNLRQDQISQLT